LTIENLGYNTNNVAELWGLLKGLQVTKDQRMNFLIAEGDSQIIINLLSHLLNGADPERISRELENHKWLDQNKIISSTLVGNYPLPHSKEF
jgi:ribonuclease HI